MHATLIESTYRNLCLLNLLNSSENDLNSRIISLEVTRFMNLKTYVTCLKAGVAPEQP